MSNPLSVVHVLFLASRYFYFSLFLSLYKIFHLATFAILASLCKWKLIVFFTFGVFACVLVHLSNKSDSRMHLLMSKLFFFSAVISAVVSSMHGITFPRFVFFTLIHKRGSTLFPILYLIVRGSTVSLSLSLSNARRRTHKPSFFFLRRLLSKVLSSLSRPPNGENNTSVFVECKCGKCFLSFLKKRKFEKSIHEKSCPKDALSSQQII